MLISEIYPQALSLENNGAWRPLGKPESFAKVIETLQLLIDAGAGDLPARLQIRIVRDDRRMKPQNRPLEYIEAGSVADLMAKARAGLSLEIEAFNRSAQLPLAA